MTKESRAIFLKSQMYVLSLWLLFAMMIIASVDVRILKEFSWSWAFVGRLIVKNLVPLVCTLMLVVCVVIYLGFKTCVTGTLQLTVKIKKIENRNADFLLLLSTYIIPLVTINLASVRQDVILIVLLIAIGFMYVKTDLFLANPTLALLGYKVYSVTLGEGGLSGVAITKDELLDGDNVMYVTLSREAYYIKKV